MNLSTSEGNSNKADVNTGDNRDYWTKWFNSDNPWDDDRGDYETVDNVQKIYGKICEKGFDIFSAECRSEGTTGVTFNRNTPLTNNVDVFERYCTTTEGLVCKNNMQSPGRPQCQDYSIQFQCHYTGSTTSTANKYITQFDIRMYIILALVPILLLLLRMWWVYVYRRRQQIRRERAISNNQRLNDSSSFASGLTKPPPTYRELFGKAGNVGGGSPVFTIARDNIPICSSCQRAPCSVALIISINKTSRKSEVSRQVVPNEANQASLKKEVQQPVKTTTEVAKICSISVNSTELQPQVPPSCVETNICITSAQDNKVYVETDLNKALPTHGLTLEDVLPHSSATVHFENEIPRDSQTQIVLASSRTLSDKSFLPLSLTSALITSSAVSDPCACPCHRTIPPKQKGVTDCISSSCSDEINDPEASNRPTHSDMHITACDHQRVCVNMTSLSGDNQSELPSYEDALELIKVKESRRSSRSNLTDESLYRVVA